MSGSCSLGEEEIERAKELTVAAKKSAERREKRKVATRARHQQEYGEAVHSDDVLP